MQKHPLTIIWRHRKENLKKCSLRGLEGREDMLFFSYPNQSPPDLSKYILLTLNAPPLQPEDNQYGLALIDATWRYAEKMQNRLLQEHPTVHRRSIPLQYETAYPRKQEDCKEPSRGLASVEALYIAYQILGRDTEGLLDHYFWQDEFLEILESQN